MGRFGTRLYDVEKDPGQLNPLVDKELEERMTQALIQEMEKSDAPSEQYERLGLRNNSCAAVKENV